MEIEKHSQDPILAKLSPQRGQKLTTKSNRTSLIRAHARWLLRQKTRVTVAMIRKFLMEVNTAWGRNYSLKADQITFALQKMRDEGRIEKYTNGKRVRAGRRLYRSIRQAAEMEGLAIETVRKRVDSKNPKFRSWRYADD